MSNLTAVIVDSDSAQAAYIREYLTGSAGWKIKGEAHDLFAAHELILKTKPGLIIIELEINRQSSFGFIERLARENPTAGIIATSSDTSSDNILRAIRSGCLEFLPRPVRREDILRASEKLERTFSREFRHSGKVIACFSSKGGSGCTTAAVNIAAALRETTGKEVLLADLDPEGGCADLFLDLKPRYSIADAVRNASRLDHSFLRTIAARHSSGISLLSCPPRIIDMVDIDRRQLPPVLEQLKRVFDYVVLDMGRRYDEAAVQAIRNSDILLIVSALTLPSIGNTQKALEYFSGMGLGGRLKILVNRFVKKGPISVKDAEKTFSRKVLWQVPESPDEAEDSLNKGRPMVSLYPSSDAARGFLTIAKGLEEMTSHQAAA